MPKYTNPLHNQNEEKEKRAAELSILYEELSFTHEQLVRAYSTTIEGWSNNK